MATSSPSFHSLEALSTANLAVLLATLTLGYTLTLYTYRLFLSPLACIPGPRIAAATGWYEFYYDCWKGGKYMFAIDKMHDTYGPIVRISPREVHIRDIDFHDRLYSVSSRLDKDAYFYRFVGTSEAAFGTASAKLHQARRKAMSRFFSQGAITGLEASVRACTLKLCERLEEYRGTGKVVNLSNAFRNLTVDVITEYSMPEGRNLLATKDFTAPMDHQSRTFSYLGIWHRHIPVIMPVLLAIPRWLVVRTASEDGVRTFDFTANLRDQAKQIHDAATSGKQSASDSNTNTTVLAGIMSSDLPPSDKTTDRLHQEAITLVGAGSETTANTLETIIFHALSNPSILNRLKAELGTIDVNISSAELIQLDALKPLPYLTAVITEGLRLACGVCSRLPRLDPLHPLTYAGYTLPHGTVVSMSIRDAHFDPAAFPDPHVFVPERWLGQKKAVQEAHFMPFGRGSRACIGKELAHTELFLSVGNLLRAFEFELFETGEEDVSMQCDFFAPFGPAGSEGVRVLVK